MKMLLQAHAARIPLADESVHCCITSPPYWGLRCYGTEGQLGLEQTPDEYVAAMVAVFREVRRVLRDDGTLWLNLGDSYYAAGWECRRRNEVGAGSLPPDERASGKHAPGLKVKDLVGIPWRVAFALQADGWYLRSDIIWSKPNPMPESVRDRPTKSHEYVFLLTKSPRYFYDDIAVREAGRPESASRYEYEFSGTSGADDVNDRRTVPEGKREYDGRRNRRTVWTVATQPYAGAHFATFPPKLIEPCILAGTSERGVCPECGAAWVRVVEREKHPTRDMEAQRAAARDSTGRTDGKVPGPSGMVDETRTTGWQPQCDHGHEPVPATVLDPFVGSGTTVRVANEHGRRGVGLDLSREYLTEQAKKRTSDVQRRFA